MSKRNTTCHAVLSITFEMEQRKRHQFRYTNGQRKALLQEFHEANETSERKFCRDKHLAYSTWQGWRLKEDNIMANKRHNRLATMGSQGHTTLIPFKDELLAYMRDRRGTERYVRAFHLLQCVKRNKREWLTVYLLTKQIEAANQQVLDEVWLGYAATFWNKYGHYDKKHILNVDETSVFFDMPPGKTLAEIGQSSKVSDGEKHSHREKLPKYFILKGTPGGVIERQELGTYPPGHFYVVQSNAWMDECVCSMYLDEVLAPCVDDASMLLVDNLACHVSEASHDKVAETHFSVVEPLPPNSSSRCQPLDVGVMGPLKAMLKTAWLLEEDNRSGDEIFTAQEKRLARVKRTILVWEKITS
ncbi:hypothetical protein DYB26_012192 [Aphanomyces astaci]|uniref:DDE-1 domain-containing protein n=2 Tax=Aphanomyces astaci TaxID=112090 RepID=A0A397ELA3_APHAT|nr:hypothetical protein DYB31_010167 [Aphanomyces astaci]RHZ09842.1 hypothetical protein DYB26_012192 [Aphanomyces astaci]